MAYKERTDEEIIAALERQVARSKSPDKIIFTSVDRAYSLRAVVSEVKKGTRFGKRYLQTIRDQALRRKSDPVKDLDDAKP